MSAPNTLHVTGPVGAIAVPGDSDGKLYVSNNEQISPDLFESPGSAYQQQIGLGGPCDVHYIIVHADKSGFILLCNSASPVANGAVCKGAHSYPILKDSTIQIGDQGTGSYERFSLGCQVVFSNTSTTVLLGNANMRVTAKGIAR